MKVTTSYMSAGALLLLSANLSFAAPTEFDESLIDSPGADLSSLRTRKVPTIEPANEGNIPGLPNNRQGQANPTTNTQTPLTGVVRSLLTGTVVCSSRATGQELECDNQAAPANTICTFPMGSDTASCSGTITVVPRAAEKRESVPSTLEPDLNNLEARHGSGFQDQGDDEDDGIIRFDPIQPASKGNSGGSGGKGGGGGANGGAGSAAISGPAGEGIVKRSYQGYYCEDSTGETRGCSQRYPLEGSRCTFTPGAQIATASKPSADCPGKRSR